MSFKVLGKTKDLRSGANVVYCQSSLDKYLEIVGNDFENFSIQRRRESHKAYQRLKQDILNGALLPSITLAVKPQFVDNITKFINDDEALEKELSKKGVVDILDGLQRTYIISDLQKEGKLKEGQKLLLEFWLEGEISKLIYRMIVLNAGQKSMSMRHQVELLFTSLQDMIVKEIRDIEIITERDNKRRTQPNKYPLGNIASSYHAYLIESHEMDKENIVAQKLLDDDAFDAYENELTEKYKMFIHYLRLFCKVDRKSWDRYSGLENENLKDANSWFGSDNVMLSFFSAVAQFIKPDQTKRIKRVETALDKLIQSIDDKNVEDPLGIVEFEELKKGLNPRKTNIGFGTRKLISTGFKEYFRDEGETPLKKCWLMAAE